MMRIRCAARLLALVGAFFALAPALPAAAKPPAPAPAKPAPAAAHSQAGSQASPRPAPKSAPAAAAAKTPPKGAVAAGKPANNGNKKTAGGKKVPRKPGEAGEPDEAVRRIIAGTAGHGVHESPELRAMRELDLALFPSAAPSAGPPWVAEGTPLLDRGEPRLQASGMPPEAKLKEALPAHPTGDLSWLKTLTMPDIPVRWDARVVRYLEYYKNNPRGRSMVQSWIRKSGRYGGAIRRVLREQNLPEDIVWLALVESGFDPTISSPVGAAGLWQFMPEGARIYGLAVDRWIDERLDPERSTLAAARYLADLRQRFGSWELAFAAYNMGYGGLLASIRKYNTNDFWELSRLESGMPFETALYVPKIVSMAIVARNKAVFACDDVELDAAINFDKIAVGSGVSLRAVALAAGASVERIEELNPQMLASRAPPLGKGEKENQAWTVRVPPGAGQRASKSLGQYTETDGKLTRVEVRWGESIDDIAVRLRVPRSSIQSLNGLRRDEVIRPGTLLFVPTPPGTGIAAAAAVNELPAVKPTVVVPATAFSYPDRRRMFYRVIPGDNLRGVAGVFGVSADDLCRWNLLDPGASLHDGMTLQVYAPKGRSLGNVLAIEEKDARVLLVGSTEFFAHFEAQRGRARMEVVAREGDTWRTLARHYGLTMGQMERINQKARSSALSPGDKLVVYVPAARAPVPKGAAEEKPEDAVAVAKPVGDDVVQQAKEEDGVKPAILEKPGVPEPIPEKGAPAGKGAAEKPLGS